MEMRSALWGRSRWYEKKSERAMTWSACSAMNHLSNASLQHMPHHRVRPGSARSRSAPLGVQGVGDSPASCPTTALGRPPQLADPGKRVGLVRSLWVLPEPVATNCVSATAPLPVSSCPQFRHQCGALVLGDRVQDLANELPAWVPIRVGQTLARVRRHDRHAGFEEGPDRHFRDNEVAAEPICLLDDQGAGAEFDAPFQST